MKFGIYLPNFGPYGDANTLADLARDAENSGWDGFFIWDHVAGWTLPMVDPWVALAAIAVSTKKIRIGTTVLVYTQVDPVEQAKRRKKLLLVAVAMLLLLAVVVAALAPPSW